MQDAILPSPNRFRVLVYGAEKLGYSIPNDSQDATIRVAVTEPHFRPANEGSINIGNGIELVFRPFNTKDQFQDYDGVIMFQGIWAKRMVTNNYYDPREYVGEKQNDELQKRTKQLQQLLKKNGFVCFLMDRLEHDDFDLSKNVLGWFGSTYFEAIRDSAFVTPKRSELIAYCEKYSVARTKFTTYTNAENEVLLVAGGESVGICFDSQIFYLPCHAPDKDADDTRQLFAMLGGGLVSLFKKMYQELPEWISKFGFSQEAEVVKQKEKLEEELLTLKEQLIIYSKYKSVLVTTSDKLRKDVAFVLESGLGYEVDADDELREDLKIIEKSKDQKNKVLAVVEVKGINGNVSREAINQVDSHRDRGGFKPDFPGILIANTFIKSANSITKKDKPIEKEQILHAHKNHVLILRTLDLLRALDLVKSDDKLREKFNELLFKEDGWLEVKDGNFTIHHD